MKNLATFLVLLASTATYVTSIPTGSPVVRALVPASYNGPDIVARIAKDDKNKHQASGNSTTGAAAPLSTSSVTATGKAGKKGKGKGKDDKKKAGATMKAGAKTKDGKKKAGGSSSNSTSDATGAGDATNASTTTTAAADAGASAGKKSSGKADLTGELASILEGITKDANVGAGAGSDTKSRRSTGPGSLLNFLGLNMP